MTWKPALTEHEKKNSRRGSLRPDPAKAHIQFEKLPSGAVILDRSSHAWQSDFLGFWYRAFGDDRQVSSFELAQIIGGEFTVIYPSQGAP